MASKYEPGKFMEWMLRMRWPSRLFDWRCGWLLTSHICRLTHVGRKTGQRHRTVLEVAGRNAEADEWMVVSSRGRKSEWYRNLHANGTAEIEVGRRRFVGQFRDLSVDEAVGVLAAYEKRMRLIGPYVRYMLSKLVGWRYDGSDAARRRLTEQLPIVAFRPRNDATGR